MNIREVLNEGGFAVCRPDLYVLVVGYVRYIESQRDPQSCLVTMEICFHAWQIDPPILIFDTKSRLQEHLRRLSAMETVGWASSLSLTYSPS